MPSHVSNHVLNWTLLIWNFSIYPWRIWDSSWTVQIISMWAPRWNPRHVLHSSHVIVWQRIQTLPKKKFLPPSACDKSLLASSYGNNDLTFQSTSPNAHKTACSRKCSRKLYGLLILCYPVNLPNSPQGKNRLHTFGCLSFVVLSSHEHTKLLTQYIRCAFLGYTLLYRKIVFAMILP